ncbi:MAG: lamin tail domain-containing protein [Verrucomicrobiae bacterium]|nr:lamin tail domain-containing protein [Verrucomicrobiae bacterium]
MKLVAVVVLSGVVMLSELRLIAAPVPVGDFSFETNSIAAGEWTYNLEPEWKETGGPDNGSGFEEYITGFVAEGTDHLGMELNHDVWQDLGVTYQANTRYTLTVAVGNRNGLTQTGNQSQYLLADATGALHATGIFDASALPPQSFADAPPLVFDTPDSPAAVGRTIRILLQARGAGRSHFDHIRLEAEPLSQPGAATLGNLTASNITSTSALLTGRVLDAGDGAPTVTFFWGTENGGVTPGNWQDSITLPGTQSAAFATSISGLNPGGAWFFTARASNNAGLSWVVPAASFETLPEPPQVETVAAVDLGATAATLGATVLSTGGEPPLVRIYYGETDGGNSTAAWAASISLGQQTGSGSATVTGLSPATTYYFRAFATNSGGATWAATSLSFVTLTIAPPVVLNRSANGITGTTANLRGEVTETGNDAPQVTIYYGSTDGGSDAEAWESAAGVGIQSGTFTRFVGGLLPNTTYYYRCYATNAAGGAWAASSESFTTTAPVPTTAVINEFHYKPGDRTSLEEFIELHNPGDAPLDLSGWTLASAVNFTFPSNTVLPATGYLVVGENPAVLLAKYGVTALGPWSGKLSSKGETIELRDATGSLRDQVAYGAGFPWPTGADGAGNSAELIHPSLDNDLGGSWRPSGSSGPTPAPVTYVSAAATGWRYAKGTNEASAPVEGWRSLAYPDGSWLTGNAPFGYGGGYTVNTTLTDMRRVGGSGGYSTVYFRKTFTVSADNIPNQLRLRLRYDDGVVVWINGTEVTRRNVPAGQLAFNAIASGDHPATAWEELTLFNTAAYLFGGDNVIAVHSINQSITSSDYYFDLELQSVPAGASSDPTPGARNAAYRELHQIPPQIRQVAHAPTQPPPGAPVTITAKITDPDGMGAVTLAYQTVDPGAYVRLTDAAYTNSWTTVPMVDDGTGGDEVAGDSIYTAVLPGALQTNRRLVRYRITFADALGNAQTVPYADDEQPNFAYYVYGELPDWSGAFNPGATPITTYPASVLGELPAYTLIANGTDVINCQYNSGYDNVRFRGTFVSRGVVYDHIEFRNRGEASTYVSGKNKWRFYFNRSRNLVARDNFNQPYAETWKSFSAEGCSSPWAALHRGMAGVEEAVAYKIYQLAGVPSANTHYYHFRVVRGAQETPPAGSLVNDPIGNADGQYAGDFWGLYLALEPLSGSFLDERGLPDGNVYKIEGNAGDKKHQGIGQPLDSSDWNTFRNAHVNSSPSLAWWEANLDLENYYTFHALSRLTGNVDVRGGYNHYFYHRSSDNRWLVLPWDLDMMFIAKSHWTTTINGTAYPGVIHAHKALLEQPALALQYRNRARELLDLVASDGSPTGGQIGQLIQEFARIVHPIGQTQTWANADAALWNMHPRTQGAVGNRSGQTSHKGNFFWAPFSDSRFDGSWTRWLRSPGFTGHASHEDSMNYLRDYAINAWPGGQWTVSNGNQLGYGYQYLLSEAADADIPARPVATHTGAASFPLNDLSFTSSAFSDPQGANTFAAIQWRLAEISAPGLPGHVPGSAPKYELQAVWTSEVLTNTPGVVRLPSNVAVAGKTYRVRVRHQDSTGRWSHWSLPVEFSPSAAIPHPDLLDKLVISEIHYHPLDPATPAEQAVSTDKNDFEFIELKNIGLNPINLTDVGFTRGISFTFPENTLLAPGEFIAVAQNLAAFAARYGSNLPVVGEFGGRLDNAGERLTLSFAGSVDLHDFTYDDASPWPTTPDGSGPSLVLHQPNLNPDPSNATNWMASRVIGGTPGADEPALPGTYAAWVQANFTPAQQVNPAISGPATDPDGDGFSNLSEFAFATSPFEADAPEIHFIWVADGNETYPALQFRRPTLNSGLLYELLASDDLLVWTAVATTPLQTSALGNGVEEVVFRDTQTAVAHQRFLRLRVTMLP